jgi:hypothetical protein
MSELNEVVPNQARSKAAFNWPVMGLAALFVAYIIWVWVNDYRVNHAPPSPPAVSMTK